MRRKANRHVFLESPAVSVSDRIYLTFLGPARVVTYFRNLALGKAFKLTFLFQMEHELCGLNGYGRMKSAGN
jgi:hypothetical protein